MKSVYYFRVHKMKICPRKNFYKEGLIAGIINMIRKLTRTEYPKQNWVFKSILCYNEIINRSKSTMSLICAAAKFKSSTSSASTINLFERFWASIGCRGILICKLLILFQRKVWIILIFIFCICSIYYVSLIWSVVHPKTACAVRLLSSIRLPACQGLFIGLFPPHGLIKAF